MIILQAELKSYFPETLAGFAQMMALKGDVYRALEGRRTQRIIIGNKSYFIKQHAGVGWKEIVKNLSQLRLPIVSAKNEWRAIKRLEQLNVPVPELVAYGSKGLNPAAIKSFIVTRELPESISLEDLARQWQESQPKFTDKIKIIKEVARIARIMHVNGINHRDFYICHFLLDLSIPVSAGPKLYLIDLHRAGIRKKIALRWLIKDLAGLYFSSKAVALTQRDLLRFMKEYRNKSLRETLMENKFWKRVKKRGDQLCRKHE